jgi:hypothetical protein
MLWQNLDQETSVCYYAYWTITRILMYYNEIGKPLYLYIAVKENIRYEGCSWDYIKRRILATTQVNLF